MCPVSSIRKTMYKKRQAASTGMGVIVMKRLNIWWLYETTPKGFDTPKSSYNIYDQTAYIDNSVADLSVCS